ncbi:MAG: 3-phosphoshikimate 1-carboxyvinyltransferase [Candidatus Delongbacteria bacterium]|nr:3-phosphoshikimate 1-carboxyvinyltransferase [Candidatus Delongbacteria bacterium]
MDITIRSSKKIEGKINAPSSKSYMQRAVVAALLSEGETKILNPSFCDDSLVSIEAAKVLGAEIIEERNYLIIKGGLKKTLPSRTINCGEAGLAIRMFTPVASLCTKKIHFTGMKSLTKRPINMIEKPLKDLGVNCKTTNGFIPVEITGPVQGGNVIVDGSLSSQFLTGLLLALPCAENDSIIEVINLKSSPYIDMTLEVISKFGVEIKKYDDEYKKFFIKGNQKYKPSEVTIEGDWSGASFLLVAGAVGGRVEVGYLNSDSNQGDRKIIDVLKLAGADVFCDSNSNSVIVKKNELNPFKFDATDCPDLFPPIVSLAANCIGVSIIKGISRLAHKESDRALVLKKELGKIGVKIVLDREKDTMTVYGGSVRGGKVFSYNDHRIAMVGAIAGINSKNSIVVQSSECISKSYNKFYDDFKNIGGNIYE